MVDNSTSPFQTHFEPVFRDEVVQRDLLFPEPVLRLKMVDKSTGPFQTHFRPVFGDEAVQRGHLFLKQGCIRVLLRAPSPNTPRTNTPPLSGFGASQAEIGNNGHESTSRAVHRRFALPAAIAGVRSR
jgi:hypothetical protein